MIDNFEKLKFQKSNAEFDDGRKMITAHLKGKFTRKGIKNELNRLAKALLKEDRNAYLGVSAHYNDPNDWCPALLRKCTQPQTLYDPTDSPTTTEYKNIDGIFFYIIQMPQGQNLNQKMHKQKKETNSFLFQK